MSWYLRKGINLGPLRLNLSKSGLGYSIGVKGARIGSGPRGNYIHLGRGAVYYRQSLPSIHNNHLAEPSPEIPPDYGTPIQTASLATIASSTADELLAEIQQKNSIVSLAPLTIIALILLYILFVFSSIPDYLKIVPPFFIFLAYWLMTRFDSGRKLVILNYHLDEAAEKAYLDLLFGLRKLASSARLWRITTRDAVNDPKYQAGASQLISRKTSSLSEHPPRFMQLNVPAMKLDLSDHALLFLPERVLLYQNSSVAALRYSDLAVHFRSTVFIETDGVPSDSQVVGTTWRYVNKTGGPDRRFAFNPQIPRVLYGELW